MLIDDVQPSKYTTSLSQNERQNQANGHQTQTKHERVRGQARNGDGIEEMWTDRDRDDPASGDRTGWDGMGWDGINEQPEI